MSDILSIISVLFLPVLISVILIYGLIHRIPIYDTFIEEAQEGLKTCVEILPFIIGIFIAIEALTTSGAMDFIENMVQPFLERIGIPEGLTSIILLRPVSGSGSLVVVEKIMEKAGPIRSPDVRLQSWSAAARPSFMCWRCISVSHP